MNTFIKYIDDMKEITGSDYMTAKIANISRQQMCDVRKGRKGLGDENIINLAKIIDINPLKLSGALKAHLAKTPAAKKAWNDALKNIAASILLGIMLLPAPVAEASHYILCKVIY